MAQWKNSGLVTGRSQVRNQVNALMPFGKALILITTRSLGEDLKPSVNSEQAGKTIIIKLNFLQQESV